MFTYLEAFMKLTTLLNALSLFTQKYTHNMIIVSNTSFDKSLLQRLNSLPLSCSLSFYSSSTKSTKPAIINGSKYINIIELQYNPAYIMMLHDIVLKSRNLLRIQFQICLLLHFKSHSMLAHCHVELCLLRKIHFVQMFLDRVLDSYNVQ